MADEEAPKWGEVLKKILAVGVSGAVLSEEVIRSYLAELKLPREILNLVVQGAQKSKEEVAQRLAKEIMGLISKADVMTEVSKFAEGHRFKVTAEIEILPKSKRPSKV